MCCVIKNLNLMNISFLDAIFPGKVMSRVLDRFQVKRGTTQWGLLNWDGVTSRKLNLGLGLNKKRRVNFNNKIIG